MDRWRSFTIVAVSGAFLLVLGISTSYLLEVLSFDATATWLPDLMARASLCLVIVGLVVFYIGSIGWARKTSSQNCFASAIALLAPIPSGALLESLGANLINVHSWTMVPLLVFMAIVPLGVVLLVIGEMRRDQFNPHP